MQQLNIWLVAEIFYSVPDEMNEQNLSILNNDFDLKNHPENLLSQQQIVEAEADYKVAKADLLPKINLQGGLQQVNGQSGFYSYQAGLSLPIFAGTGRSRVKATKLESEIAQTNASFKEKQLASEYKQAFQNYQKWQQSWNFYKTETLPLASEQRKGALLAYKEGALDYAAFTQLIRDAIQTEIDALDSLDNYLNALFELQYFKN